MPSTTMIVAVLGVLATILISQKSRIMGLLKGRQEAAAAKQDEGKAQVANLDKKALETQAEAQVAGKKAEAAQALVQKLSESGNEQVQAILKEPDTKKLMDTFNQW